MRGKEILKPRKRLVIISIRGGNHEENHEGNHLPKIKE